MDTMHYYMYIVSCIPWHTSHLIPTPLYQQYPILSQFISCYLYTSHLIPVPNLLIPSHTRYPILPSIHQVSFLIPSCTRYPFLCPLFAFVIPVIKQRVQMYDSPYRGVVDCAKKVWRHEGIKAFYRSYTTQVTMNIPFQSLHFVVYESMRARLNPQHNYDPKTHLIAGATAGALAAAVTTPLDVAKTLLNTQERGAVSAIVNQGHKERFVTGMIDAVRAIYRLRGVRGYFQGLQARIVYQAPSCAICWSTYEFLKFCFLHEEGGERCEVEMN